MNGNIGKTIRTSDFIDSSDGRSLLLDTTVASCLGATSGLEDLAGVLEEVNYSLDGVIVNPGQAEHHADLLGGRERAAPVVRVDWTNAYRGGDFCLPASSFKRLMISDAQDASELGASAVVASLLLGFDDDSEAKNIESLSLLARDCYPLALPLVVDIRPVGEKVVESNFEESIKLGVSFMQELGADVLIIPDCSPETLSIISGWVSVPVLTRLDNIPIKKKVDEIFDAGLSGIVLSEKILVADGYVQAIKRLHANVHKPREKNVSVAR